MVDYGCLHVVLQCAYTDEPKHLDYLKYHVNIYFFHGAFRLNEDEFNACSPASIVTTLKVDKPQTTKKWVLRLKKAKNQQT